MSSVAEARDPPAPIAAACEAFWYDANVGLYLVGVLGPDRFVYEDINPAHERATGLSHADLCGRMPQQCLPSATAEIVIRHYAECVATGRPVLYTETLKLPAGEKIWQTNLVPVRGRKGEIAFLIGCCRDVTELVQAEREVARVSERLVEVQEEERRRIAQELHDSTSQHLVAVQLGLAALRQGNPRASVLDDMSRELAEAHKEIRTLSYLLHPPELARHGLTATLRGFTDGFSQRTGIAIALEVEGQVDRLAYPIQRAVFRVVQESLANAHRHAAASSIAVTLGRTRGGLELKVTDDGRRPGEPPAALIPGVGIAAMQARIQRFGGRLSVTPTALGVEVSAFIPAAGLRLAQIEADAA